MIERIRNFLCNADPLVMTIVIMLVVIFGGEAYVLGGRVFLLGVAVAVVSLSLVFGIGWLLCKGIVLLQRLCGPRTIP